MSLIRKRSLKKMLNKIRKIAPSPKERLVLDIFNTVKWKLNCKFNYLMEQSEYVLGDFFKQIKGNLFINNKVLTYLSRVSKIQKQWKTISKKKRLYVEMIKKMWIDSSVDCYYELLAEREKFDLNKLERPMKSM